MTEDEKKCIVDAIEKMDKRSKSDRIFAYIALIVMMFFVSVIGYDVTRLIDSLSVNMQSIAKDMKVMSNEIVTISHNIDSMESSVSHIASDVHAATTTHEDIAQSVERLDKNIKKMQGSITDMNKLNPLRKIF